MKYRNVPYNHFAVDNNMLQYNTTTEYLKFPSHKRFDYVELKQLAYSYKFYYGNCLNAIHHTTRPQYFKHQINLDGQNKHGIYRVTCLNFQILKR